LLTENLITRFIFILSLRIWHYRSSQTKPSWH